MGVSDYFGAAALLVSVVALIWTAIQGIETKRSRELAALLSVVEMLQSREAREARLVIHSQDRSGPAFDAAADVAGSTFQVLAFLHAKRLIPDDFVADLYGAAVVRGWSAIEEHVRSRRLDEGQERLWSEFESLASRLSAGDAPHPT